MLLKLPVGSILCMHFLILAFVCAAWRGLRRALIPFSDHFIKALLKDGFRISAVLQMDGETNSICAKEVEIHLENT